MDRHLPLPAVKDENGAPHRPEACEICQHFPPVSGYVEAETSRDKEKKHLLASSTSLTAHMARVDDGG